MGNASQEPLIFRIFTEISLIDQTLRTRLERALPGGMRLAHFVVLNHLARLGECNPLELARAFRVTKGAMTNTLQRLDARGFVDIRPDPRDGRAKLVAITPAGRDARRAASKALTTHFGDVSGIPSEEIELALPFLSALRVLLSQGVVAEAE